MTTRPRRIATRAAIGELVGRRGILEQRVDERSDRARLGEDDQRRDDEQRQDHRRQPPPLVLPEEEQELAGDAEAIDQAFDRAHNDSYVLSAFSTTQSPSTSTSIPLCENVWWSSAGGLTRGCLLRLNDASRTTSTPSARPRRSM